MPPITATHHIRVARPTSSLAALHPFYITGLGFTILSTFTDHDGFDGLIIGLPGAAYHLEFTVQKGVVAPRAPSVDNLLVIYMPDGNEWTRAVKRMEAAGFEASRSGNPYWDVRGRTFEDGDGYRVVLQNAAWGS